MKQCFFNAIVFICFGIVFSLVSVCPKKYVSYSMDKLKDRHPEMHQEFLAANQDLVLGRDSENMNKVSEDPRLAKIIKNGDRLVWLTIIINYFILPVAFGFFIAKINSNPKNRAIA